MYRVYVSDSELESQVLNSREHMWAANMLEIYNRVLRASACWFSLDNRSHSWSASMGTNLIHTLILAADPELNNREITTPMLFRTKTEFLIIFFSSSYSSLTQMPGLKAGSVKQPPMVRE